MKLCTVRIRLVWRGLIALGISGFGLVAGFPVQALASDAAVTDIGSRRELFVDEHLIERLTGEARLRLHEPKPEPKPKPKS